MARGVADPLPDFRIRLIRWILMAEQWPFRIALVLAALEDSFFRGRTGDKATFPSDMPLWEVYEKHLKWFVHDMTKRINDIKQSDQTLRRRNQKLISLDGPSTQFEQLLRLAPVRKVWPKRVQ